MKKVDYKKVFIFLVPLILLLVFEANFIRFSKTMVLGLLLAYSFYFILAAIFKNTKWATLIVGVLEYIILIVSKMKLAIQIEPFYFTDLVFVKDAGEINTIIDTIFWDTLFSLIPFLLFALVVIGVTIFFSFKYNIEFKDKKPRILMSIPCVLIMLIMFLPIEFTNKFILNTFFDASKKSDNLGITNGRECCEKYGHLAGIYGSYIDGRIYKPDNYDEKKIKEVINNSPTEEDKSLGKPNIIVIFSESFWDVDQLDEIEFDKPITENFNKLKEEGLFFNMISPSFGGNSANVEFEFLTGGSLAYFSRSFLPYMGLYNSSKYKDAPNIINELSDNGYYTKLVPFSSSALFRCGEVYKYLKLDEVEYIPKVDKKHTKGLYPSDEYAMDKAIEALENKDKDKPLFYMTMTMEAHMPFVSDKFDKYDIKVTKSDLSDKLTDPLKVYAQGIYDADKQLGRLYEYIKNFNEPTILVFYGDHLPFLDAINHLKFFNTDDEKLNYYRRYNTQSLVLANFDISNLKEENENELKYLGPDILSSYLLNHMDIDISNYFKWIYSTRNITGAFNRYVSVDPNGKIYYTRNLNKKMQELYDIREAIQYKYFIKIK